MCYDTRSRSSLSFASPRRRSSAQQAPDRTQPPQPGPAAGAEAAGDPEAAAVERPAGLDRRAARSAGRAGQPRRLERHGRRSAGQVRRRQPDGGDARRRRGQRDRRSSSPTRSTSSAPTSAPTSGIDSSAVRLHVPVARLADALPIMADVALRPTFPHDELERLRQQRLTALLQARDDPPTIAAAAFPRVLFGPAHRYGTPAVGHRRDDQDASPPTICARSTRPRYRPDNATLIVVGDVTADKADAAAREELRRVEGDRRRAAADKLPAGRSSRRRGRSTSSTSRARRSRRSASAGSACRARRPTTSRSRC